MLPPLDLGLPLREHLRRALWQTFPEVLINSDARQVKRHSLYSAAKGGDARAAEGLVWDTLRTDLVDQARTLLEEKRVHLLPVHALEELGMNAIPRVLARVLSQSLDMPVAGGVIQINRVAHTGADGYHRLAFPPAFSGDVLPGEYLLIDDFMGKVALSLT